MKFNIVHTIFLESCFWIALNWPSIGKMTMRSQFADMILSSTFCDVVLFPLSSLVTGPTFMSMSSLVLQLSQLTFIMDWPKVWKSEIPLSKSCPISGDWIELGIPNLARMSLMKYYWMLQNTKVTAFFWFIKGKPTGEKLPPTQIRVKKNNE